MKRPSSFEVPLEAGATTTALVYAADGQPPAALVLGHGAGANQHSAFMVDFAHTLSQLGLDVITFNFLYTEQKRKAPDRAPVLEACYRAVIAATQARMASASRALFVGGKSMGGRMATQVAAADASLPIAGLVLLGYPLHPPGRPDRLRDAHLASVRRPMLVVQGSRDAFGTPDELAPILKRLSPAPTVHVVAGGDHSFKLSRKDPAAQAAVYAGIQRRIASWVTAGGR